jgi:hypothetical protein
MQALKRCSSSQGAHFLESILHSDLLNDWIASEIDIERNKAILVCDVAWKRGASEKIIQICWV